MHPKLTDTIDILEKLVSFQTLSRHSNRDFIDYCRSCLEPYQVACAIQTAQDGKRHNLLARIGPETAGGIMLNGHTDVVPASSELWSRDPFQLHQECGRLYGRGTTDMKGFIACVLASCQQMATQDLQRPIFIGLCYDEEVGGLGAPDLAQFALTHVDVVPQPPALCIVGEPTGMQIVAGSKGCTELRTVVTGSPAHSSDPRQGVSAIALGAQMITHIYEVAHSLETTKATTSIQTHSAVAPTPPYPTISVGTMSGGTARNVIAEHATFLWEIRAVSAKDTKAILAQIDAKIRPEILRAQQRFPEVEVKTKTITDVPVFPYEADNLAVSFVRTLTGLNSVGISSYATDAPYFHAQHIPTVIYGPGSIAQCHVIDEFIETTELQACLAFLDQVTQAQTRTSPIVS